MRFLIWGLAIGLALFTIDRLFLWLESKGWMYYRRKKPRGGAAVYHLMQIHSVFEPGFEEVIEIKVQEEKSEDESGAPPGTNREDAQSRTLGNGPDHASSAESFRS
jgi:hypothetical protein